MYDGKYIHLILNPEILAGIYIHIPFCRQLCHYCDFHFTVSLKKKPAVVAAIIKELMLQRSFLHKEEVETIYFGGGTPSVLSLHEMEGIFKVIFDYYSTAHVKEITLEANPDDLTAEYLRGLKELGINRLSIGIQSFFDHHLKLMNRRHTATEAEQSIDLAKNEGFQHINIDLIYGFPNMKIEEWNKNLSMTAQLEISHLSAYHLTFEPKTVFSHKLKKGKIKPIDEKESLRHFDILKTFADQHEYDHYEISNFAKNGLYSRHNTNYWLGKKYLGIGPSAHSYDLKNRQWNISNNTRYVEEINSGNIPYEKETLTQSDQYNDYMLTRLRTKWGANTDYIREQFGDTYQEHAGRMLEKHRKYGNVEKTKSIFYLTKEGMMIADAVISDFMY